MDPTLLVTGAMILLKPLMEKASEKAFETIGEKMGEKVVEKGFWKKVKDLFIVDEEKELIQSIEKKEIATSNEIAIIENKLKQEVLKNPSFAEELKSNFNISSTNMFFAEQLLKSFEKDKEKLENLIQDKRLAGISNEDQYELEIQRVVRRMVKDEEKFRHLFNIT